MRVDVVPVRRRVAELDPQPANIDRDRAVLRARDLLAPHATVDLGARDRPTGILGEYAEHVDLGPSKPDAAAGDDRARVLWCQLKWADRVALKLRADRVLSSHQPRAPCRSRPGAVGASRP
jgi:hypothetical protein